MGGLIKDKHHPKLLRFVNETRGIEWPVTFNFPFYYTPHPLSELASQELQSYLSTQTDFEHPFFASEKDADTAIGKMFGVLVVEDSEGSLGYLAAFSGKLADSNQHKYFVPPIYDMLDPNARFMREMEELNAYNAEIDRLEARPELEEVASEIEALKEAFKRDMDAFYLEKKEAKAKRKKRREEAKNELSEEGYAQLLKELSDESISYKYKRLSVIDKWEKRIREKEDYLSSLKSLSEELKEKRKKQSSELQGFLFDQYHFLNAKGERANVRSLFEDSPLGIPPAGAGECAAPKLLQYAYQHGLKPICMAEFWWGDSPKSEVRKHKQFYPACNSKCKPILGHMLEGLQVDENPFQQANPVGELEIVYEDDYLVLVNKPPEFLSVPGKFVDDCVSERMRRRYPEATGPLTVHRLDMSTSGLIMVAKDEETHRFMQHQFIKRKVKKRYVALLEGELAQDKGEITLPLRVDLDDRPRQVVCYEHGKNARTKYEVIRREEGRTLVYFYPVTGRTHQLRVHSAHHLGLSTPIVGDDLYGRRDKRLHLHAEQIEFVHPETRESMVVRVEADFVK